MGTIRTFLQYRNKDSSKDLNTRLQALTPKGMFSGGNVIPIALQLKINVDDFFAVGVDGMVTQHTGTTQLNVAAGITQHVILRAIYKDNALPIAQLQVLSNAAYLADPDLAKLIRLCTITLAPSDTQVLNSQIDYSTADRIDMMTRFFMRGTVPNFATLATLLTAPSRVRIGDIYFAIAENQFYLWTGASWIPTGDQATINSILTHRGPGGPGGFTNEKHLTDNQLNGMNAAYGGGVTGANPVATIGGIRGGIALMTGTLDWSALGGGTVTDIISALVGTFGFTMTVADGYTFLMAGCKPQGGFTPATPLFDLDGSVPVAGNNLAIRIGDASVCVYAVRAGPVTVKILDYRTAHDAGAGNAVYGTLKFLSSMPSGGTYAPIVAGIDTQPDQFKVAVHDAAGTPVIDLRKNIAGFTAGEGVASLTGTINKENAAYNASMIRFNSRSLAGEDSMAWWHSEPGSSAINRVLYLSNNTVNAGGNPNIASTVPGFIARGNGVGGTGAMFLGEGATPPLITGTGVTAVASSLFGSHAGYFEGSAGGGSRAVWGEGVAPDSIGGYFVSGLNGNSWGIEAIGRDGTTTMSSKIGGKFRSGTAQLTVGSQAGWAASHSIQSNGGSGTDGSGDNGFFAGHQGGAGGRAYWGFGGSGGAGASASVLTGGLGGAGEAGGRGEGGFGGPGGAGTGFGGNGGPGGHGFWGIGGQGGAGGSGPTGGNQGFGGYGIYGQGGNAASGVHGEGGSGNSPGTSGKGTGGGPGVVGLGGTATMPTSWPGVNANNGVYGLGTKGGFFTSNQAGGVGLYAVGGATSGLGAQILGTTPNGIGMEVTGYGTGVSIDAFSGDGNDAKDIIRTTGYIQVNGATPGTTAAHTNRLTRKNIIKAWGRLTTGGSPSMVAGFNVSTTITYPPTVGINIEITMQSPMADTNYIVLFGSNTGNSVYALNTGVATTTTFSINGYSGGAPITNFNSVVYTLWFVVIGAQ